MPELPDSVINAIAEKTAELITAEYKQLWIDREAHYNDHLWITQKRAREEEDRAFKRKVANGLAIWAAIAVVGFLAWSTWRGVTDAIRETIRVNAG